MSKTPDMPLVTVPASAFTWTRGGLCGIAEASDFGAEHRSLNRQVWSDSCDAGFLVRGKKETHVFLFSHDRKSSDGEVLISVYVDNNDLRRCVHIIND
jgi:hypothetical protein